jgi:hypothetical protein
MRHILLTITLLLGCSGGEVSRAPSTPVSPVAALVTTTLPAPISVPSDTLSDWRDFDALPSGAIRRLGSQRYLSRSTLVAIKDDGMMAIADAELGILEIRRDGMYRAAATERCQSSKLVQYVGEELRAHCNKFIYVVKGGIVATKIEHSGESDDIAMSRSGGFYAYARHNDNGYEIRFMQWPNIEMWKFPVRHQPKRMMVTDAGEVIAVEQEQQVELVRGGKLIWSKSLALEWSGLGSHLVGWIDAENAFVRIDLADGKIVGRAKLDKNLSVDRNIGILPDDSSYFVALRGLYPTNKDEVAVETFRARIDAKTGKLISNWRGPDTEYANAISPNGKFAASIGPSRVQRVQLDDTKVRDDRPSGERPGAIALSADGKTAGYVTDHAEHNQFVLFDTTTGKQRAVAPAPNFARSIELSPDARNVAIAGQFNDFGIYNANTGAAQCTSKQIAGSSIWWQGSRIVAMFPGDNGDDCDEITEASITVANTQCKLINRYDVYGMMRLLETNGDRTIIEVAEWKNKCGAGFELKPWKTYAIDHNTGAKTALPKRDVDTLTKGEVSHEEADVLSADGKTRMTARSDDDHFVVSCIDIATKKLLARYVLPNSAAGPFAIAADGKLMAATDRGSMLLYPCRP